VGFGIYLSRKGGGNENTKDYFLASKALPWWAVGGSLIASNISTEQILGMNGSGYVIGLAIGTYELMAAATLLIVAKFFLPIFIDKGIFTMPQFLEKRYDNRVRTILAIFWVALFVFVNISTIFYLGGLAIQNLMGVPLAYGIVGLVLYSAAFSIFGGLKAVVWTDVVQVVVLVIGGFMASIAVVSLIGDGSFFGGLGTMVEEAPERFDLILDKSNPNYSDLPGISVLIGGMWIANLYYWGNNQYIIQRALAAKTLGEAQRGVAFAAFLKIFMPLIVVVPGIAAYMILQDPTAYGLPEGSALDKADSAFPWVLNNFVGVGFKGLVFAALVAAIGSSISSLVNSASTIWTLDLYRPFFYNGQGGDAEDSHLVRVGKISAAAILIIGALVAPLLQNAGQVFQVIQEYTGFISPGVLVVFIFGLFWRRATANAALVVVILSFPLALGLKFFMPELPFLDRMGFVFLICAGLLVMLSLLERREKLTVRPTDLAFRVGVVISLLMISVPSGFKIILEDTGVSQAVGYVIIAISAVLITSIFMERKTNDEHAMAVDGKLFKTDLVFNVASIAVILILSVIYAVFW
ncbi:MAG: sodium/solute symporter, partial [Bacteroidota bacterium]